MSDIIVPVSSLLHAASVLSNDRCNYVGLTILDAYDDDGEHVPAALHFSGFDTKSGESSEYDDLDIDAAEELSGME